MSHKAHPRSLRIGYIAGWDSKWVGNQKFSKYLEEDFIIRKFLEKKLREGAVEKIEIERFPGKLNIVINSARPGLIIGRGGRGVEELKATIINLISKKEKSQKGVKKSAPKEIRLEIKEIKNPWVSAPIVAQWVAQRIEKRLPYRRVLKEALGRIANYKEVQGIRIEVAGRLNGITIARREWMQKGRLPRQTLRADIDYGFAQSYCTYGVIGVKVWIYRGEKFPSA